MQMVAPLEVGICCRDIARLAKFYVEVFRCRVVSEFNVAAPEAERAALSIRGYGVMRLQTPNGERIKLLAPELPPRKAESSLWILEYQNTTYLTFIVGDLPSAIGELEAYGATLLTGREPVEVRPGVWLCFARDPEGNLVELVEYADVRAYRETLAAAASE